MVGMHLSAQIGKQPTHRETKLILQLRKPLRIEKKHEGTMTHEMPGRL
jgi:hypothetical protein